jgi:hypothetical protein
LRYVKEPMQLTASSPFIELGSSLPCFELPALGLTMSHFYRAHVLILCYFMISFHVILPFRGTRIYFILESLYVQRETFEGTQDTYVICRTVCYLQKSI